MVKVKSCLKPPCRFVVEVVVVVVVVVAVIVVVVVVVVVVVQCRVVIVTLALSIHEQEVSFNGEAGLHESLNSCEKNPNHEGFTPISELCTERLPEIIRYPAVADFLISKAQETVRLSCPYTSPARPDNYCFSSYRGRDDLTRYGSGRVWSVYSERVRYDIPCPFADCTEPRGTDCGNETGDAVVREREVYGERKPDEPQPAKRENSIGDSEKCSVKNGDICEKTSREEKDKGMGVNVETRLQPTRESAITESGKSREEDNSEVNGKSQNKKERDKKCCKFDANPPKDRNSEESEVHANLQCSGENSGYMRKVCGENITEAESSADQSSMNCNETRNGLCISGPSESEMKEKDTQKVARADCGEKLSLQNKPRAGKSAEHGESSSKEERCLHQRISGTIQTNLEVKENKGDRESVPALETDSQRRTTPESTHQPAQPQCKVSGYFRIHTAKHVVFDDAEARQTTVEFFYDDHCDVRRVIRARGVRVARSDQEGDYCVMDCVTHDRNLGPALDAVRRRWTELWPQVKGVLYGTDVSMVVSHPHGCSKQFSIGRCLDREWGEVPGGQGWYRYTYDAATCPGSSGAPVWVPGRDGLFSGYAPHSGSFSADVARSAVWFFWDLQKNK
ncbi:hypothetical protein ElyMa_006194400 [Elysia marginata]|uniref:Peptidase S1 domain-containing protein n=1 Tax=Elysia marginata TaxID=1093978 RepID=A0AAV4H3V3_9GAST|nr:hypothetical protein ElyMa_006194400 [Elysia marginata]